MNWKLILLPVAVVVEIGSVVTTGFESGFGNWVFDRELGDSDGKWWQTREQAKRDEKIVTTEN